MHNKQTSLQMNKNGPTKEEKNIHAYENNSPTNETKTHLQTKKKKKKQRACEKITLHADKKKNCIQKENAPAYEEKRSCI